MSAIFRGRVNIGSSHLEVEAPSLREVLDEIPGLLTALKELSVTGSDVSAQQPPENPQPGNGLQVVDVVNRVKDDERYELIEANILSRRSELNRVLLALFFAHQIDPLARMSTSEIELITDQLNARVKAQNVNRALKGAGNRFVSTDKVRSGRAQIKYRLNRAGVDEVNRLLSPPSS